MDARIFVLVYVILQVMMFYAYGKLNYYTGAQHQLRRDYQHFDEVFRKMAQAMGATDVDKWIGKHDDQPWNAPQGKFLPWLKRTINKLTGGKIK